MSDQSVAAVSRTEDQPVCRVCGGEASLLVSEEVSAAPESAVYRCTSCDLVYLHPIQSVEEEGIFYEKDFPAYMADRHAPGGKDPEKHFNSYQPEAQRRLRLVGPYLQPHWEILEVGSSTGYFLKAMAPFVPSVTGVEPGKDFREFAIGKGVPTVRSIDALEGRTFDALFLYYVVEHLREPVGFLADLRPLLRPKGKVFVEVPCVNDVLISTYNVPAFGPFYWQRAHYYYYSPVTLTDILRQAGYEVEVFPEQRYDLSNHIVWMLEGRPGGLGRYSHIFDPDLDAAYKSCLKRHWICDTVFAVAEPAAQPT